MNADKRLALLNLLRLGKGSCPIGKHPRKKLLTRGASYKPPALPGDTYCGILEHISVWVNRGDSQGNLDGRVFGDRFGILETIDVEALFFGPA